MEAKPVSREDEDVCVICLSAVTERAVAVPCNHCAFDFICLVSWTQQRPTCPLCKADVTAVQYDWRSPTDFKHYAVPRPRNASTVSHPYHNLPHSSRLSRRPYERPQPDAAVLRRRHVYRHKLYSFHIGSNPFSGFQEVTPEMVANSPELQSKARTWIRRELRVFTFLHTDPENGPSDGATTSSNAEFLLSYIVAILKRVDLKASDGHAENLLTDFLGRENARLFLHELYAWLRSPFTKVVEWDREVQYEEPLQDQSEAGRAMTCG
ncbi:hypothetical protein BU23DRAFT_570832 [Bimuria novae-zelandiae CBS 107.79]|uniref:RING-type E3 ubiquitin transferase n=1 Tax=Bimuria novae-zelandiae CBS 107.79 TaxID=1447943 RepID=A0A6A5VAZ3_9PLEO|nr:hypothetical protein BU23DRAFT_570832 [Bimuria novae-zelandiae CBS 107.79]